MNVYQSSATSYPTQSYHPQPSLHEVCRSLRQQPHNEQSNSSHTNFGQLATDLTQATPHTAEEE